jgi:hypothetical protein
MFNSSQIHSTFLTLKEFARPRIFSTGFSFNTVAPDPSTRFYAF